MYCLAFDVCKNENPYFKNMKEVFGKFKCFAYWQQLFNRLLFNKLVKLASSIKNRFAKICDSCGICVQKNVAF